MSDAQVLLFRAGGLRLGVFLAELRMLLTETELLPIPFAHQAMAGLMMSPEHGPLPVFDLSGLVDNARPAGHRSGATVALFPTARGPVGLRLDALLGTIARYEAIEPGAAGEIHALAPALRATVTSVATHDGMRFFFFSPDAFLAGLAL